MKQFRVWIMMTTLLASASTAHAMSPTAVTLGALYALGQEPCVGQATRAQLPAECKHDCGCPALETASWFAQGVRQSLQAWQRLRCLCAGSSETCERASRCCETGGSVTVNERNIDICPHAAASCQSTGCGSSVPGYAKDIHGQRHDTAVNCGRVLGCGVNARTSMGGYTVYAQAAVESAKCCCAKDCKCCDACKAKNKSGVCEPSSCTQPACPAAMCQGTPCTRPAPVAVRPSWLMPSPPPPAWASMPFPLCDMQGSIVMQGVSFPRVVAVPMPMGAMQPAPFQVVRREAGPDNTPRARHAHLVTPDLEAHCERMTHTGDLILLEGDVRLVSRKNGRLLRIEAHRVIVNTVEGTFTVESDLPPARPGNTGVSRTSAVQPAQPEECSQGDRPCRRVDAVSNIDLGCYFPVVYPKVGVNIGSAVNSSSPYFSGQSERRDGIVTFREYEQYVHPNVIDLERSLPWIVPVQEGR